MKTQCPIPWHTLALDKQVKMCYHDIVQNYHLDKNRRKAPGIAQ